MEIHSQHWVNIAITPELLRSLIENGALRAVQMRSLDPRSKALLREICLSTCLGDRRVGSAE